MQITKNHCKSIIMNVKVELNLMITSKSGVRKPEKREIEATINQYNSWLTSSRDKKSDFADICRRFFPDAKEIKSISIKKIN